MNENQKHALLFKALSDEKRLGILALLKHGEQCACVLSEHTGIAQSALSYHMRILCEAHLVKARQEGKWTHYRLSKDGFSMVINILHEFINAQEEASCQ